jgi:hypothetical protein
MPQRAKNLLIVATGSGDRIDSGVRELAGIGPHPVGNLGLVGTELPRIAAGRKAHVEQLLTE